MTREKATPLVTFDRRVLESNREAWLEGLALRIIEAVMEPAGYSHHAELTEPIEGLEDTTRVVPLAERLHLSCSWPSSGGTRSKQRVVGQCWGANHSVGAEVEICISMGIDDPLEVAGVIVHELGHAAVGNRHKHDGTFAKFCKAVGLEGKPTATTPGEQLGGKLLGLLKEFPPYPHRRLQYLKQTKSQKSRFLKVYCKNPECETQADGGYKFRLTRIWIDRYGMGEDGSGDLMVTMGCPGCSMRLAVELPEEEE